MKTKTIWKKYEKLWRITKDNIGSKNNNSFDAKYIKIRFYSDDDLTLKKLLDLYVVIIVIRSVFYDGDKYFSQVSLNDWFYKLSE